MTSNDAIAELGLCVQLKKRVSYLELRLKYKEASGDFDLNEIKDELEKANKIKKKYVETICDRIRCGELIKVSDEQFLILHYIDGYSSRQIAQMLDKKIENTKTQIHNAVIKYAKSYSRPLGKTLK